MLEIIEEAGQSGQLIEKNIHFDHFWFNLGVFSGLLIIFCIYYFVFR